MAWFYRLLRNALADRSRRRATEERALQAEAAEATEAGDEPLHGAVCQCIGAALDGIAPQSASLVKRVDLEGAGVSEASREAGITANNAGVKLHRARAALRDELRAICGACAAHG